MTQYTIRGKHSLHESHTKFYQVWHITDGDRTISFTHWGSADRSRHGIFEKFSTGRNKVMPSAMSADEQARAKIARGYAKWIEFNKGADHDSLSDVLSVDFGFESDALERVHLFFALGEGELPDNEVAPAPVIEDARTPAERGESWGTW